MLTMLLQQPVEDYDLSALRFVLCGSAPLSVTALEEWERRVPGSMVLNGYGCTESGSVITTSTVKQRKIGTVGTPIPYLELEIRDDEDRPLPPGEIGEVCCKSPGVMQGYWKAPEATAATLRGGWLHTGDVGMVDEEGYLTLVDRKKDLIIRGGFNVYPRDVEDELMTHPSVAMAAVVGRPDPKMGEEVVAYVSLRPGFSASPEELVGYAKQRLAANKYPREVHIVDAIPLTSVGKTDRKALRERLG
jgi:long-chain acyl-CoA synthetase